MSIRQRASVIVIRSNEILAFHAEDPLNQTKFVFLPGGKIENGEAAEDTARRETLEETGYSIELVPATKICRHYLFNWNGQAHNCETHFFLAQLLRPDPIEVNDADYHRGVVWIPIEKIKQVFGYHKDILEPTLQLVDEFSSKKRFK